MLPQHSNYKKYEKSLYQERSGYFGERALDYPLKKIQFPHFVTHHTRLEVNHVNFQMDTNLWTPRYNLIIEAKDYTGHISLRDGFNQIVQQKEVAGQKVTNVYDDPVLQVEEQKLQLELWLETQGLPVLPIETLVVMTNPRVILNATQNSIYQEKVIPLSKLSSKLREINQHYNHEHLTLAETRRLASFVASQHQPWKPDVFHRLGLGPGEIRRGVRCPSCRTLPMKWERLRFECSECGLRSADAYIGALKEFFLLYGDQITNRQFRWWTGVESPRTANAMLKRAKLIKVGDNKKTFYRLSYDYENDFNDFTTNKKPAGKFKKHAGIF
ncbi:nuclease-related domain-containing protein [Piscibacillus sp. B03]|uniref:nuclease-related domain-containing protein n=1 Tax=Piscibacillus sp. B03 TaxID=3457430 RepID=UPI003FCDC9C7